jgi:hypothetical protein
LKELVNGKDEQLGFRMDQVILLGAAPTCPDASDGATAVVVEGGEGGEIRGGGGGGLGGTEAFALAKLRFNDELRRLCRVRGCLVADPSDDLVDYATGRVHRFFWSEPREMHCSLRKYFFYHRAVKEAAAGRLDWC